MELVAADCLVGDRAVTADVDHGNRLGQRPVGLEFGCPHREKFSLSRGHQGVLVYIRYRAIADDSEALGPWH